LLDHFGLSLGNMELIHTRRSLAGPMPDRVYLLITTLRVRTGANGCALVTFAALFDWLEWAHLSQSLARIVPSGHQADSLV
jgi:hypothetical protein